MQLVDLCRFAELEARLRDLQGTERRRLVHRRTAASLPMLYNGPAFAFTLRSFVL
jgi:hypothetical protein